MTVAPLGRERGDAKSEQRANNKSNPGIIGYDISCSPLRGVPEVPYSLRPRLQSVSQRVVSKAIDRRLSDRMDTLLLVQPAAYVQPMEFGRVESLCGFHSSPPSRLRTTGRNMGAASRWRAPQSGSSLQVTIQGHDAAKYPAFGHRDLVNAGFAHHFPGRTV